MIKWILALAGLAAAGTAARAQDFDYYLLALTWTPSFCAAEARPGDEQCDPDRDLGFAVHGLWPQFEDGWPEFCEPLTRDPTRGETAAMADVMGSGGLAWYQWRKHGRCTGLEPDLYFAATRLALAGVTLPRIGASEIAADELEAAFLDANPSLLPDDLVVTCRDGMVREVRICLDQHLAPRDCGADVLRSACRYRGELAMPPPR